MAYVTLDEIVRSLLSQEGKSTPHDYAMYLDMANRGMKELSFDILGDTKVALLLVSSTLKIDLPADFVDYVTVGIIGTDTLVHSLGAESKIPVTGGIPDEADSELTFGTMGVQFGLGGGQNKNGYYKPQIDYSEWQMILTSVNPGTYIYLEYISDGVSGTGDTVIHPYAEEALRAYIYWKACQRRRNVIQAEKEAARRDYYNEKRLARARLASFTKEELLQQIRKGFKQAPKL